MYTYTSVHVECVIIVWFLHVLFDVLVFKLHLQRQFENVLAHVVNHTIHTCNDIIIQALGSSDQFVNLFRV